MWEALTRLRADLADCAATAVWAISDDEAVGRLDELIALFSQLVAIQARAVRDVEGRGVPAAHGMRSVVPWLVQRYRLSHQQARRLVELGRLLDGRPALDKAITDGAASVEQVE